MKYTATQAAHRLYIDIETYSATDVRRGVYRYSEDPDFTILMAAWAMDNDPLHVEIGEEAILNIPGLFTTTCLKVAHNAAFERVCLSRIKGLPVGEYLDASEWLDTQAVAAEHGLPQSLKEWAVAVGAEPKDEAGSALIRWFCVPDRNGRRRGPESDRERWDAFVAYCRQDVGTMRDALARTEAMYGTPFPTESEWEVYLADQAVNDLGTPVDLDLARAAVAAAEDNRMSDEIQVMAITGVNNPGSTQQLLGWLDGCVPDLKAASVEAALAGDSLTKDQRRVLELRQSLALTASKKYQVALDNASPDGRLRGGFRFYGAHTGRWAGRGIQLQNLPRAGFDTPAEANAAILDLKMGAGASAHTLKSLVRPLLVGPFTVCDYSAIEARVVAWLAGEEWALEAFASGRDIYVETASRMGGGMTRKEGKVAVLALGYNGGVNSLRAMGGDRLGGDGTLLSIVRQWRNANKNIVRLWKTMDRAFYYGGEAGDFLNVETDGPDRALILPSGRSIIYHDVRAKRDAEGSVRLSFNDPKSKGKWRTDTYGGRLVENATQAVARDVLGAAMVRLQAAGYGIVGHIHDEVIVDGASDTSVEDVRDIMVKDPGWAAGLPLNAAGYTCDRYRKE